MEKNKLIEKIWNYCKNTHNDKDYEDLINTFSVEELKEILEDLKNN